MIGKDGHNYPDRKGAASTSWKGGRQLSGNGAIQTVAHGHPHADERGRIYEHILVAEKALGHYLPDGAEIHHVNTIKTDNRPENLVICGNHSYHMLLHRRMRAFRACGNAEFTRCRYCRKWDSPSNLTVLENPTAGVSGYHKSCAAKARRRTIQ